MFFFPPLVEHLTREFSIPHYELQSLEGGFFLLPRGTLNLGMGMEISSVLPAAFSIWFSQLGAVND